ncbi:50S ribosomal protein L17 [Candidatus Marinamargulisbacteria bacterium SCGC AAA071-K20]|nr:50S ribosomal protein L17 [Candidatus Marinamargulisbacteria bacterium SCGC AAA071-K20]
MRHSKGIKKLNKPTDQRVAMLKNMVISLFEHNRIQTTDARAKEAKKMAESLITLGKKGTLHARRLALQVIPHKPTIKQLFSSIATKYKDRSGGYTRIVKIGLRRGDGAIKSLLELVE